MLRRLTSRKKSNTESKADSKSPAPSNHNRRTHTQPNTSGRCMSNDGANSGNNIKINKKSPAIANVNVPAAPQGGVTPHSIVATILQQLQQTNKQNLLSSPLEELQELTLGFWNDLQTIEVSHDSLQNLEKQLHSMLKQLALVRADILATSLNDENSVKLVEDLLDEIAPDESASQAEIILMSADSETVSTTRRPQATLMSNILDSSASSRESTATSSGVPDSAVTAAEPNLNLDNYTFNKSNGSKSGATVTPEHKENLDEVNLSAAFGAKQQLQMVKHLSTGPSKIIHNFIDVPGICIPANELTGDIVEDVARLFKKENLYQLASQNSATQTGNYRDWMLKDSFFDSTQKVEVKTLMSPRVAAKKKSSSRRKGQLSLNSKCVWKASDPSLVGAELIHREWIKVPPRSPRDKVFSDISSSTGITLMQFNMLADGLCGGYLDTSDQNRDHCVNTLKLHEKDWNKKIEKAFHYVSAHCLQWRYRGVRLCEEILRVGCDLVCLQECDQVKFMYEMYLQRQGYDMVFQQKLDSPCVKTRDNYVNSKRDELYTREHQKWTKAIAASGHSTQDEVVKEWNVAQDGCCILWKKDLFEVVGGAENIVKLDDKEQALRWADAGIVASSAAKKSSNKQFTESVQCSVYLDLFDTSKPIYEKAEYGRGKLLGYEKLEVVDEKKSKKLGKTVYKKIATSFVALHLRHKATGREFLLVTSHLKSEKSALGERIRKAQIEAIFGWGPYRAPIEPKSVCKRKPLVRNPEKLPVLFCADLNAKPVDTMKYDDKAGKMVVDYGHECYQKVTQLGFESLYKRVSDKNAEPEYTTWKERKSVATGKYETAKHTIDYIFSKRGKMKSKTAQKSETTTGNGLNVTHYLGIPDVVKTGLAGKALLPDWHYPSDHFSLAVRMEWQ